MLQARRQLDFIVGGLSSFDEQIRLLAGSTIA